MPIKPLTFSEPVFNKEPGKIRSFLSNYYNWRLWGGRSFIVLPTDVTKIEEREKKTTWLEVGLRVLAFVTILIPTIALCLMLYNYVARRNKNYEIVLNRTQQIEAFINGIIETRLKNNTLKPDQEKELRQTLKTAVELHDKMLADDKITELTQSLADGSILHVRRSKDKTLQSLEITKIIGEAKIDPYCRIEEAENLATGDKLVIKVAETIPYMTEFEKLYVYKKIEQLSLSPEDEKKIFSTTSQWNLSYPAHYFIKHEASSSFETTPSEKFKEIEKLWSEVLILRESNPMDVSKIDLQITTINSILEKLHDIAGCCNEQTASQISVERNKIFAFYRYTDKSEGICQLNLDIQLLKKLSTSSELDSMFIRLKKGWEHVCLDLNLKAASLCADHDRKNHEEANKRMSNECNVTDKIHKNSSDADKKKKRAQKKEIIGIQLPMKPIQVDLQDPGKSFHGYLMPKTETLAAALPVIDGPTTTECLRQLIQGLSTLHDQNIAHGRLIGEDCSYGLDPTGKATCKITNFAMAVDMSQPFLIPPEKTSSCGITRELDCLELKKITQTSADSKAWSSDEKERVKNILLKMDVYAMGAILQAALTPTYTNHLRNIGKLDAFNHLLSKIRTDLESRLTAKEVLEQFGKIFSEQKRTR